MTARKIQLPKSRPVNSKRKDWHALAPKKSCKHLDTYAEQADRR